MQKKVKFYFLHTTHLYREKAEEVLLRKEQASYFPSMTSLIRKNLKASQKGVRLKKETGTELH